MDRIKVPFAVQQFESRGTQFMDARLVNLFPEQLPENARSPVVLLATPGRVPFGALNGPVRGLFELRGALYAVVESKLYSIAADGTATSLALIPGAGRVEFAANTTQIAICAPPAVYVYDYEMGVFQGQVTALPDTSSITTLDGYGVGVEANTGTYYITGPEDFFTYNPLDFASAESQPDNVIRVIADHRELWFFGERTIEIWVNSGDAVFPFVRQASGVIQRGCIAAGSVAQADNGIFFVGDDRIVYRANGQQLIRVSEHWLERLIETVQAPGDIVGWSYAQEGHTFYGLSLPGIGTYVYDIATAVWHQRRGYEQSTWDVLYCARAYNRIIAGGSTGGLYRLDLDSGTDPTGYLRRQAVTAPVYQDGRWVFHHRVEVEFRTGVGLNGQPAPQAMLRWSDDGGMTWGNERWVSLGAIGQYKARAVWHRCGRARNRVYELTVTDPVLSVIGGLIIDVEVGL